MKGKNKHLALLILLFMIFPLLNVTGSSNEPHEKGEKKEPPVINGKVSMGEWTEMTGWPRPPGRNYYGFSYDAESDRVVLYGGISSWPNAYTYFNDTWSYDYGNNSWSRMNPVAHPTTTAYSSMTYDSKNDRIIYYGGIDVTWAYDLNTDTWVNRSPIISPSYQFMYKMAYDSESDRIILFGGGATWSCCNDTWVYDYSTNRWTNMSPKISPPVLFTIGMTYDSVSDRIILYGQNGSSYETWTYDYDSNSWFNMNSSGSTHWGYHYTMGYDLESHRTILLCTLQHEIETWSYDYGNNTWKNMNTSINPPARSYPEIAYDSKSDRMVFFGGPSRSSRYDETWSYNYDSNQWIQMDKLGDPTERYEHSFEYDSESDRAILFGGSFDGTHGLNDTWAYDYYNNTWENMTPGQAKRPPTRFSHAMAYDSESDRMILFGGLDYQNIYSDTWAYDYNTNTWMNMSPSQYPPVRLFFVMSYDSKNDRVILFGGYYLGWLNETWSYDYNTNKWTNMSPSLHPSTIGSYWMIYNSKSNQIILFGNGVNLIETWVYDYYNNSWKNSTGTWSLRATNGFTISYDEESDRIILFGGIKSKWDSSPSQYCRLYSFEDTWVYNYNTDTWTNVSFVQKPMGRWGHTLAYNSKYDRTILFGGSPAPASFFSDTWAFHLDSTPPHVITTIPSNGESGVAIDTEITISWSEDMNQSITETAFSSSPNVSCIWSWKGNNQTCRPNGRLLQNTEYTITIALSASDVSNNTMIRPYVFKFATSNEGIAITSIGLILLIAAAVIVALIAVTILLRNKKCTNCGKYIPKRSTICPICKYDYVLRKKK